MGGLTLPKPTGDVVVAATREQGSCSCLAQAEPPAVAEQYLVPSAPLLSLVFAPSRPATSPEADPPQEGAMENMAAEMEAWQEG